MDEYAAQWVDVQLKQRRSYNVLMREIAPYFAPGFIDQIGRRDLPKIGKQAIKRAMHWRG